MNERINLAAMFAAYMGAKYIRKDMNEFAPSILTPHLFNAMCEYGYIEECKLILTPLSKISDEDARYVCSVVGFHVIETQTLTEVFCSIEFEVMEFHFGDFRYKVRPNSHTTDFLRSKSYDCGYMDMTSLIDTGYAIASNISGVLLVWGDVDYLYWVK